MSLVRVLYDVYFRFMRVNQKPVWIGHWKVDVKDKQKINSQECRKRTNWESEELRNLFWRSEEETIHLNSAWRKFRMEANDVSRLQPLLRPTQNFASGDHSKWKSENKTNQVNGMRLQVEVISKVERRAFKSHFDCWEHGCLIVAE